MNNTNSQNSKILINNLFASVVVKVGGVLVALLTTPAYIQYFDNSEILGAWFTILSVLAWILTCDMGIGNGLRNGLVYAINQNDYQQVKKIISSAYIFLFSLAGIIMLTVAFFGSFVSWNRVFNISTDIVSEKIFGKAVTILLVSILLQFVLRLVTSIFYALQKAFIPGLLSLITNIIMLVLVTVCNLVNKNNNIVQLAFFYLFAVNVPLIFATVFVFAFDLKEARPKLKFFSMDSAVSILSIGSQFLWLQLMALILDNTNSYLISNFVGNSAVVEYHIYYKIFSLPGTVVILLSTSMWSIITKAKAEKNYSWLRKSYYIFMAFCVGVSILELLIIPVLQPIFDVWLGNKTIPVDFRCALIFSISGSIMAYRTFLSTYSNGMCKLKIQIICLTVGAAANIPLAYVFSRIEKTMLSVIIANIICMIPYCVIETFSFCRGLKKDNCSDFIK